MTAPAEAWRALGAALLLGAGLGLYYEALCPLRMKWTALADLLFTAALLPAWVVLCFGLCGGEVRFFQSLGLLAGAAGVHLTLGWRIGRALTGAFRRIRQKFQTGIQSLSLFFRKRRKL